MANYEPTIGLEVHVELKTATKMFCNSKNDPDEKRPNVNICPICLAHPGTLPVPNKKAIEYVLRVGLAVGGTLADYTEFDRKNYFYPDIPKGYQLSQYKYPLVSGGELGGVKLTRIHIEEDTARSIHAEAPRSDLKDAPRSDLGESLIDFNRAGVPLMELVTEPVIHSAKEAVAFARELKLLLSPAYLDVSEANMEKGEMRVEANISVKRSDLKDAPRSDLGATLGTKVEIKNLNSFRAVERAIEFEIKRQTELLEKGEKIIQETRGWDENKEVTFSQRQKETSDDYRYFPDPDIPKLFISQIKEFKNLAETLPELPNAKRERYALEYGIKPEDIETYITNISLGSFFEKTAGLLENDKEIIQTASNLLTSDILGLMAKEPIAITGTQIKFLSSSKKGLSSEMFAGLVVMYKKGEVSSRGAKDILAVMVETGDSPRAIAEDRNLFQKSDEGELAKIIEQVIAENPRQAAEYKAGNEKVLQYLVGQGMKLTAGAGNPSLLAELLKKRF
ncbi:MAG: Asp-tRNA(Asn)/Glu-tRNA(Gln) amidotransferase GatCAB subunit B [Candidatus Vogelbacteria bacterium CG10_big_fil_rev_8_21_14_0_10_50_13]|uniref:Aspartyl/glutamyl-tRNA(Asn/Gln) amidotransferase subunit B n=1 Tax=Candidatus Vogelbacteria bacterium CG10_big_fil_rev_8_21_14_0_10_50_13 TaxID=1975044 RepID=A0A2H0RGD8_9BACT|nr:MAG: Asp-tRNA(Asn)/Glu-tRNA(Gln) amidotransferase GatCAB subunit B [Candidatus Vogelbacteria bacterium CG10_big_fil_rev_8_21_14_0_10_50_13]